MSLQRLAIASLAALASGAVMADGNSNPGSRGASVSYLNFGEARDAAASGRPLGVVQSAHREAAGHGATTVIDSKDTTSIATLPLAFYDVRSSRDGLRHQGVIVGTNPFTSTRSSQIPAKVIPVVLVINSILTNVDSQGNVTTKPGKVVLDPTKADNHCLSAPNNVPVKLLRESPLFDRADFNFGGTFLGHTQYEDAFMRANFFGVLGGGGHPDGYHVLFDPIDMLQPLLLNVPAAAGWAVTEPVLAGLPLCAPLAVVDFNWLDQQINDQILPAYATQGVNPTTLPIFFLYATFLATPLDNLFAGCCIGGYHSFGGHPTPHQAYSVFDFDVTGIFGSFWPDSTIGSHELGEFINDPWGNNLVPPWGGTGQVAGCQGNLEVGDPLSGTAMPAVKMPNGFTYHLQELAFFSWFLGAPSIGLNGWFSSNGTFATDAGTPCVLQ
jgi:hypothetical protein